jgi:phosphotransferase system enzyme I (PtsI)
MGVSRGIAIGKAYLLQSNQPALAEYVLTDDELVAQEIERFNAAVLAAQAELNVIRDRIPASIPVDITSFIDTHLLMLEDKALARDPVKIITQRRCNAEWALKLQRDTLVNVFEEMDDPYLRTRKDDVDHVVNRILRILLNQEDKLQVSGKLTGCVIVADDLSPADTVTMQNEGIVAFVTEYGGPTSHTTILARSLGIPAVVGVRNVLRYVQHGEQLVVDGHVGVLLAGMDQQDITYYRRRHADDRRQQALLRKLKTTPAVSRDGRAISLRGNVELPEDLAEMKRVGARGVGLYRTEYLFLNREELPSEEEQYEDYLKLVRALNGAPLTIRTLDLGADKALPGERRFESRVGSAVNPALGLRAIRLCLRDTAMFKTQLRAILRVSAEGPVNLMIPMLSSIQEILQTLELIEQAKRELGREGKFFDERLPVGGMIEVPAAALSAEAMARHLDFFSIGTNDLIQYTLAADRLDTNLGHLVQPTHPAVLKLIDMTIRAGHKAGIPVAMCGEMAGEPRYTRLLLGLGLREFSMQPAMIPEIKHIIQNSDIELLTKKARRVLRLPSTVETELFVDELNVDVAN